MNTLRKTQCDAWHADNKGDNFVTLGSLGAGHWSDNSVTLLPGQPRRLKWLGERTAGVEPRVDHLVRSYRS